MRTQAIRHSDANINNKYIKNNNKEQTFKGGNFLDLATKGLELCDKYPMIGVAVTDSVATDVPRVVVDLKKTGVPAAAETFRREFSGLFVNCLMPSFIVLGVGKLFNKPIMGNLFPKTNMSSSWADGASLDKFVSIFKSVKDPSSSKTTKEEISSFIKTTISSLEGLDGSNWIKFSEKIAPEKLDEITGTVVEAVYGETKGKKHTKELLSKACSMIADSTHATQTLRFQGTNEIFGSNLQELIRDQINIARKFGDDAVRNNLDAFKKQATKLVNTKSLLGLGIIIPIAMSIQSINRAMTRKKYNQKGAPIYNDFEKGGTYKEMNENEKKSFFGKKLLAGASFVGLALLSMMKKPSLPMFQFKGMFPTVDQCRWIATSTFVSRIFASEDENELRESTVRDMASFAGLYFLGDYAAKIAASTIEKIKPNVKLLNRNYTKNADDSVFKKVGNWVRRTSLKSFDEVLPNAKNMRSVCQLASLGFSIISLGVLLPAYNRKVTEKKVAQAKLKEQQAQKANSEQSELIIRLREDKDIGKNGVYSVVANDCFK